MTSNPSFPGRAAGWLLRLVLGVAGAVLAVSLLVAGVLVALFVVVRALLTGRKPAFIVAFNQFRRSPLDARRPWAAPGVKSGEVVDVEARELSDTAAAPAQSTERVTPPR
jgi:hypothetical protein